MCYNRSHEDMGLVRQALAHYLPFSFAGVSHQNGTQCFACFRGPKRLVTCHNVRDQRNRVCVRWKEQRNLETSPFRTRYCGESLAPVEDAQVRYYWRWAQRRSLQHTQRHVCYYDKITDGIRPKLESGSHNGKWKPLDVVLETGITW